MPYSVNTVSSPTRAGGRDGTYEEEEEAVHGRSTTTTATSTSSSSITTMWRRRGIIGTRLWWSVY